VSGPAPIEISVFDKALAYRGQVAKPKNVVATSRDFALTLTPGTAVFEVDADEEIVDDLAAKGARVVVDYFPDPTDLDSRRVHVSGRVWEVTGDHGAAPVRTFAVTDDAVIPSRIIGRPVPGGSLATGQGTGAYEVTGPAETVVKTLVTANLATVSQPLVVAPDLGRGDTITASVRMQLLTDRLPGLPFSMLCLTVRQVGAQLVLDARTPTVHTVPISEEDGLVTGSWTLTAPEFTRVIVAGGEVGGVTKFREVINAAAEAEHGDCGWGPTVEARDTTDDAVMDAKGWEALNAANAKSGLSVQLAETEDWRFGEVFDLGDVVPIQMSGAPVITDRVREVEIRWDTRSGDEGGLTVTPRIGEHSNSADRRMAAAISSLARIVRSDRAGRA
jgi:hypothetical protein